MEMDGKSIFQMPAVGETKSSRFQFIQNNLRGNIEGHGGQNV